MNLKNQNIVYLIVEILVIILDQMSKLYVISNMDTTKTFSVCQYLNIVLTFNFGTSFGILSPSTKLGMHSMVFVIIAIVIFLTFWFFKSKSTKEKTFLSLVTAGAIGNLIDRFLHGAVVDFIDFHYNQYHWPAFNVADSSICIGCALFFVFSRSK